MTSAPDRRRTSMAMTASIGSVPSAIGTRTLREFEAIAVTVKEEEREGEKKKRLLLSLSFGVKFVEGSGSV